MNTSMELTISNSERFRIDKELSKLRFELNNHKIYQTLKTIDEVRTFMENHVFAVWDFMSVLKALQCELTSISIPWTPKNNPNIVRFINEIVYGEESDVNELGEPKSHFEMYLDAMTQIKANTNQIDHFIKSVESGDNITNCLNNIYINNGVKEFTKFTFDIIDTGKIHCIASAFTYGREDIIPEMFIEILNELDPGNLQYSKLKYYLDRHIEVDGEIHGPIAQSMIKELCGTDQKKWDEAMVVARSCIQKRIQLWDAIHSIIKSNRSQLLT